MFEPEKVLACSHKTLLLLFAFVPCLGSTPIHAQQWVPLFNGGDLTGWTPKFTGYVAGENFKKYLSAWKDGFAEKLFYDQYTESDPMDREFGHLFYEQPFSHFRLRAEYRFIDGFVPGALGWMRKKQWHHVFTPKPAETMELDQEFPVALEFELLGGFKTGAHRPTGALCTINTVARVDGSALRNNCFFPDSETYRDDSWVTVELEVHGSQLMRHYVNGELVMEYSDSEYDPRNPHALALAGDNGLSLGSGYIGIQAEGNETQFRLIEIMDLDPNANAQPIDGRLQWRWSGGCGRLRCLAQQSWCHGRRPNGRRHTRRRGRSARLRFLEIALWRSRSRPTSHLGSS